MKQSSLDDSVVEIDLAPDDDTQPVTDPEETQEFRPPSPRPDTPTLCNKINKGKNINFCILIHFSKFVYLCKKNTYRCFKNIYLVHNEIKEIVKSSIKLN